MGIFGWSLPPGCNTLPDEEPSATDITKYVEYLPNSVVGVFWDEDGNIISSHHITIPEDKYNGTPEYVDIFEYKIGHCNWDDDLSDENNFRAAAAKFMEVFK